MKTEHEQRIEELENKHNELIEDLKSNKYLLQTTYFQDFIEIIKLKAEIESIKNERELTLKEVREKIEELIEHRNNERKNNNIFRKSSDDLNEDFLDNLEELKKELGK